MKKLKNYFTVLILSVVMMGMSSCYATVTPENGRQGWYQERTNYPERRVYRYNRVHRHPRVIIHKEKQYHQGDRKADGRRANDNGGRNSNNNKANRWDSKK